MPTLASPTATARTAPPPVATNPPDSVAGSDAAAGPGGFAAIVAQLTQPAAGPAAIPTPSGPPAPTIDPSTMVPALGKTLQPTKITPGTDIATSSGKKPAPESDTEEASSPLPTTAATDPSLLVVPIIPPAPAAVLPAAVSTSPPTGKAPTDISDDARQVATPSRIADQRSVAAPVGPTDDGQDDPAEKAAPAVGGKRPAGDIMPTATGSPDPSLLAAQTAPAAAPAADAPSPDRPGLDPVPRQTQTAALSAAHSVSQPSTDQTKSAAINVSEPPLAAPKLEQPSTSPIISALASTGTAPAADTRPASAAAPPSPAAQVARAIVEPVKIALTKPDHDPAVPHVTTIQIAPEELGRVEIRIERPTDGPAKIQLVAERAETLSRLMQDQSQLSQALDGAGLPQHGRTLEFSLAPATAGNDGFSSQFSGGNASGGSSQGRSGRYPGQDFQPSDDAAAHAVANSRALRSGIDITA